LSAGEKEGKNMTKDTSTNPFSFPFSGDVTQAINPWALWLRLMSQIGFVNINLTKSSDPALERRITEDVAGYGRQLGRVIELLEALLTHTDKTAWSAGEKKALDDFLDLAAEIAALKGGYTAPTKSNVDRFIEGIRRLKESDGQKYGEVIERLRKELAP